MEDDAGSRQQQQLTMLVKTHDRDERIDGFWEHYRPYELTVLADQYSSNMPNSVRCRALSCHKVQLAFFSGYSSFTCPLAELMVMVMVNVNLYSAVVTKSLMR